MQFPMQNPFVSGMQTGAQTAGQMINNQYAPGLLQQQLQQAYLNNQLLAAKAQYAQPSALAALQQAQQLPGLTAAQASQARGAGALSSANAQTVNQERPYQVLQQQGAVLSSPPINRLWQIQQAQRMGVPLWQLGIGNPPPGVTSGNPQQPNQAQSPGAYNAINPAGLLANGGNVPANSAENMILYGTPYNPFQYKQQEAQSAAQGSTSVQQWNDSLTEARQEAAQANDMNMNLHQFSQGYDNSRYKGGVLGTVPTSGWESSLARGVNTLTGKSDMAPEQEADKAGAALTGEMTKLLNLGRFTNLEMQTVNKSNVSRQLDAPSEQQIVNLLQQKAVRMQEKLPFMIKARQLGLDPQTSENQWNSYIQNRPVYDYQNNKPNTQYINTGSDYLTPQAVQAGRTGQPYNPPGGTSPLTAPASGMTGNFQMPQFKNQADFQNWYRQAPPQQQQAAKAMIAQREQKSAPSAMRALPLTPQQEMSLHSLFGG